MLKQPSMNGITIRQQTQFSGHGRPDFVNIACGLASSKLNCTYPVEYIPYIQWKNKRFVLFPKNNTETCCVYLLLGV